MGQSTRIDYILTTFIASIKSGEQLCTVKEKYGNLSPAKIDVEARKNKNDMYSFCVN